MKKLTSKQLKEKLQMYSREDLIDLIAQVYRIDRASSEYISGQVLGESYLEELLEEKEDAMYDLFFPARILKDIPIKEAKKIIADFEKICKNPILVLDLRLYFVECGVMLTNLYGDLNLVFYNAMTDMFRKVTDEIGNMQSRDAYRYFIDRLEKVVKDTDGIGWGFHDNLAFSLNILKRLEQFLESQIPTKEKE